MATACVPVDGVALEHVFSNMNSSLRWYHPATRSWLSSPTVGSVSVPTLDGRLSIDLPSRYTAAEDWGRVIHHLPVAVLYPGSVDDVVRMVRFCRSIGIRIGARGQAHTTYGQAQVQDGLIIEMRALNRIHSLQSDHASVDAGLTWRDLLSATVVRGLTPPVLTDYLPLTVGGTLSIGGISGTSYRNGAQVDNTLELDVVTGEGEVVQCSLSQNRNLFESVLGGMGQCAIIVRATVKLIPAPAHARIIDMTYADFDTMLADFRTLLFNERFSYIEGLIPALPTGGFGYILEGVLFYNDEPPPDSMLLSGLKFVPDAVSSLDNTYFEFCDRVTPREAKLREIGSWDAPHPWFDTFIPGSQAERHIPGVLASLSARDVPDFPNLVYGFRKSRLTRRFPCTPDEEVFFLIDILRTTDPEHVSNALAQNREFYDEARSVGGRLYPISAVEMSPADWRDHFGAHYEHFLNAKTFYDPDKILTPGPGIFD